uniref:Chromo domain-containing protein n=1 Tax=Chelonoidis abingdonii TaxID=106734 RepID=A0A8C0FZV3_CHEAB
LTSVAAAVVWLQAAAQIQSRKAQLARHRLFLNSKALRSRNKYFLVKWKGWPESSNTWVPLKNLKCPLLLQYFHSDKNEYLSQLKRGKAVILKNHIKALNPVVAQYIYSGSQTFILVIPFKQQVSKCDTLLPRLYELKTLLNPFNTVINAGGKAGFGVEAHSSQPPM